MAEGLPEAETDQMCRTCMRRNPGDESNETTQQRNVFDFVNDFEYKQIKIHELLNCTVPELPKIEVLDALPKVICLPCLNKLKAYYEFQNCCIKSDLQLRNLIPTVGVDVDAKNISPDPLQVKQELEEIDEPNNSQSNETNQSKIYIQKDFVELETFYESIPMDVSNTEEVPLENLIDNLSVDSNRSRRRRQYREKCLKCDICETWLTTKQSRQRHMLSEHNINTRMKTCIVTTLRTEDSQKQKDKGKKTIVCENATTQKPLRHGTFEPPETLRYQCEKCEVTFTERKNLQRHMRNIHDVELPRLKRPWEKRKSEDVHQTPTEQVKVLSEELQNLADDVQPLIKIENSTELETNANLIVPLPVLTDNVNLLTTNMEAEMLKNQIDIGTLLTTKIKEDMHAEQIENDSPLTANIEYINKRSRRNTEKTNKGKESDDKKSEMWECPICKLLFQHKKNLLRHAKMKHNEEPIANQLSEEEQLDRLNTTYKCDQCNMVFSKIKLFNAHKMHHIKNTCRYCKKSFKKLDKMRQHELTHGTEKPYLCADCGKTFSQRGGFARHRVRHSTEGRRHQCPQCPKMFFVRNEVSRHIRQVHNTNKPCVCEVCGAGFKQPYCLRAHMLTHNTDEYRFKCDYCDKRFPRKDRMERHRRVHTNEKPFECEYCSRCYKAPSDLRKHLDTHLDNRSYFCELCPEAFPLARDMRAHFATHIHDDEETKAQNLKARHQALEKIKRNLSGQSSKAYESASDE